MKRWNFWNTRNISIFGAKIRWYAIMNFFQHVASRNDRKRHASTNWIFIASNERFTRSAHLPTVIHLAYANHRLPRHIETSYFFFYATRFPRLKIIPSKTSRGNKCTSHAKNRPSTSAKVSLGDADRVCKQG